MSVFYIRFILLLLITSNYVFGLLKLPICQCECCPGEQCESELLVFSVDKCSETTCSSEHCYEKYPKKCGLIPGITNTSCDIAQSRIINSSNAIITLVSNTASFNLILPIMIIRNILFCFLLKFLFFI